MIDMLGRCIDDLEERDCETEVVCDKVESCRHLVKVK